MKYAFFLPRLSAFFLDSLILGLPFFFILGIFIIPILLGSEVLELLKTEENFDKQAFEIIYNAGIKVEVAMIFLWGVMCAAFVSSKKRATPGKRLMKLQVVTSNNERVKFFNALGRYIALPLVLLTLQTPERYMIYEKIEQIDEQKIEITTQDLAANYLQTPLTSLTNILTLILFSAWIFNISRDREKRAFHDILFDTRVIYAQR